MTTRMHEFAVKWRFALLLAAGALLLAMAPSAGAGKAFPDPPADMALAKVPMRQSAVFAGGCFWGMQAVFEHVRGVEAVVSGYAGGRADQAEYVTVSRGNTGHAESVRVDYDPSEISYGTLLKIFFSVAHDPTELDRQGPDVGTQYRSAIFVADDAQRRVAAAYIAELDRSKAFAAPVVTRIAPLTGFYPAEYYHQHYVARHPDNPYVAINDLPKLRQLRLKFPALYRNSGTE